MPDLAAHLGSEKGQDASAAAHVQDDFPPEQELVLHDGVLVAACAHGVLEHLLMDACRGARRCVCFAPLN